MFEKIIEKIEEEIGNKSHECLKGFISDDNFTGYCHAANYVIEILKEEENKPFTPESFGFKEIPMMYPEDVNCWQYGEILLRIKKHDNSWDIFKKQPDNFEGEYTISSGLKIKNQFQGETILRSLDIID